MSEVDPRYPIGRLQRESTLDPARRAELIAQMDSLPEELALAVAEVAEDEWELPYRDGGWTIRQVVHHLADSHINAFARFRLALTEDTPTIKPYLETKWAELPDVAATPPAVSVAIIGPLHARLVALLRGLPEEAFAREVFHPEQKRTQTLDEMICIYGWHGRHHVAHIRQALQRGRLSGV